MSCLRCDVRGKSESGRSKGGAQQSVRYVCTPSEVAQGPSQFGLRPSVLRWSRLDPIGMHVLGLMAATMAPVKRDGLFRILAH